MVVTYRLEVLYIHGCKGVTNTGLEIFTMYRFNVALRREECATRLIGPCVASNNCKETDCDICKFEIRCKFCAHNVESAKDWYCE
ncbi:hypothetical protein FCM35_KLT21415 [Carex littledalei]|uniref:Uncharacterized protein n=1 Tax=Carex littledalei TaxID=544730 RepID=A0A833VDC8_9POAL|nr:hypothetical protein FCM35_KLT21415 [Carex littledalei]